MTFPPLPPRSRLALASPSHLSTPALIYGPHTGGVYPPYFPTYKPLISYIFKPLLIHLLYQQGRKPPPNQGFRYIMSTHTLTPPAPASFRVRCSYCSGEHTATLSAYGDGAPFNGHPIYGVTDCPSTTPYGVTAASSDRIPAQPAPAIAVQEYTFTTETVAHDARRALIGNGVPVSLIAFDPSRNLYVFDA